MKQVVIAVLLVCPTFALAQSRGDIVVVRDAWINVYNNKNQNKTISNKNKQSNNSLSKAIERQIAKRRLEFQRKRLIIRALLLGEKLPWESNEDYRARIESKTTMQGQPFK